MGVGTDSKRIGKTRGRGHGGTCDGERQTGKAESKAAPFSQLRACSGKTSQTEGAEEATAQISGEEEPQAQESRLAECA